MGRNRRNKRIGRENEKCVRISEEGKGKRKNGKEVKEQLREGGRKKRNT